MKFLVRVDDFPRVGMDFSKFMEFDCIMKEYGIPYLLGTSPLFSAKPLDPENLEIRGLVGDEKKFLRKIGKLITPAYHGTTHQTLAKKPHSEFVGLSEKETEEKIKKGLSELKKLGLKPAVIMPPFNTFDLSNLQIFKKYFKIVTGGPETVKIFGKMPIGNLDGILYIPSYQPFYGQPDEIYGAVAKTAKSCADEIKCITFHWGWDIKNKFDYTRKIAELIEGNVLKWDFRDLEKKSRPVKIIKPTTTVPAPKPQRFQYTANRFVLNWIKSGRRMLDLACGNCQLMDYAKSVGSNVDGTDIKPQRKGVIKHDLNKKLPFEDRSFDTVSCIDSLEHVRNLSNVFMEVNRVLKNNGTFIVTVPNTRWYKNHGHISFFTYRYLRQLIKYSNFKIAEEKHYVEIPKISKRFVFDLHPEVCFHLVFKLRKQMIEGDKK